jgi:hypothetical protein
MMKGEAEKLDVGPELRELQTNRLLRLVQMGCALMIVKGCCGKDEQKPVRTGCETMGWRRQLIQEETAMVRCRRDPTRSHPQQR